MGINPHLIQISELESKAIYAIEALDTIRREGSVSKTTLNSLMLIGVDVEGYSGVPRGGYSCETYNSTYLPTLEGVGQYAVQATKQILVWVWKLIKGLLAAIANLFKWIKGKFSRNRLGLDKASLLKELAPSIEIAYRRTGINPSVYTAKIERTLVTPVVATLNKGNVIPLNKTYIGLRDNGSVYFKESCLSRKDDKRTRIIFDHLEEWVEVITRSNISFKRVCSQLNTNAHSDLHRVALAKVLPTGSAIPPSVDAFMQLSKSLAPITEETRWKLFYTKTKEHHDLIAALAKKDPELVKSNRLIPSEILNSYVMFDIDKLGAHLGKLESLYKEISSNSLETLTIKDTSLLPEVIRISGELKYIVLGAHHASTSLSAFVSAVDVLQTVKYSILEDMKHYLRVA